METESKIQRHMDTDLECDAEIKHDIHIKITAEKEKDAELERYGETR